MALGLADPPPEVGNGLDEIDCAYDWGTEPPRFCANLLCFRRQFLAPPPLRVVWR